MEDHFNQGLGTFVYGAMISFFLGTFIKSFLLNMLGVDTSGGSDQKTANLEDKNLYEMATSTRAGITFMTAMLSCATYKVTHSFFWVC